MDYMHPANKRLSSHCLQPRARPGELTDVQMVDDGVLQAVRRVPQVLQLRPDLRQHLLVVGDLIEGSGQVLASMMEARGHRVNDTSSVISRGENFPLFCAEKLRRSSGLELCALLTILLVAGW